MLTPILRPLLSSPLRGLFGPTLAPDSAILHFDADIDAFSEQTGGPHTFNHAVLSPQYQRNADGSYTNVGAKPAVDTFDGKKWLRSCGAVQNMLTNSVFAGAASGTPGTAPTGWGLAVSGGATTVDASGSVTLSAATGARHFIRQVYSVLANTSYCFTVRVLVGNDTTLDMVSALNGNPSGSIFSWKIDGVNASYNQAIAAGVHDIEIVLTVGVTPGSVNVNIGAGVAGSLPANLFITPFNPQLTASAYPLPYVPTTAAGPVTQPASNATVTNGMWFSLPDGSPLWQALDGKPDGVELVTNGGFDTDTSGWSASGSAILSVVSGKMKVLNGAAVTGGVSQTITTIVGQRYKLSAEITIGDTPVAFRVRNAGDLTVLATETVVASKVSTLVFIAATTETQIQMICGDAAQGDSFLTDNISIQRIQPQPLTLATRVMMGVGSGDLPLNSFQGVVSTFASSISILSTRVDGSGIPQIARGVDSALNLRNPSTRPWQRANIIQRFVQVSSDGTMFRIGFLVEGVDTTIQWGPEGEQWGAFSGSFGPSTLYRLMLGYGNAYPMWYNKITAWPKQCTDAELLEAWP